MAVLGIFARGKTTVAGAGELRVKESDRIHSVLHNISLLGGHVQEHADGFTIYGPQPLYGSEELRSFGDHRIAMAISIAASFATGKATVDNTECIDVSFPGFLKTVSKLGLKLQPVS